MKKQVTQIMIVGMMTVFGANAWSLTSIKSGVLKRYVCQMIPSDFSYDSSMGQFEPTEFSAVSEAAALQAFVNGFEGRFDGGKRIPAFRTNNLRVYTKNEGQTQPIGDIVCDLAK